MRFPAVAVLIVTLALTSALISAEESFERVHVMPFGEPGPVAAVEDLAVYGITNGILVVDVSDPASPIRLSRLWLPGSVQSLLVKDDMIYVAGGDAGVVVVDLTNPGDPTVVRVLDTPGNALEVSVVGSWLFVADFDGGLRSLDLDGEGAEWNFVDVPSASEIAIDGNLALVRGYPELWVINVSDPDNMNVTATIPVDASDLAIEGQIAFVGAYDDGLLVFSLADPVNPIQMGSFTSGGTVRAVDHAEELVYLSSYDYPGFGGIRVIDVANPWALVEIGSIDLGGRYDDLCLAGSRVHLGSRGSYHSPVVDVSAPSKPVQSGAVPTSSYAGEIMLTGDLALIGVGYGASGPKWYDGIDIVDLANPADPVDLATISRLDTIVGFAVDGSTVVLVDDEDVLSIYDISTPTAPVQVGALDLPGFVDGVAIMGALVFVADDLGVRTIDISDPSSAVEVGFIPTSYQPRRLLGAAGHYVFYGYSWYAPSCYGGGFGIVDVSESSDTFEVGFGGVGYPEAFVIAGDRAFDIGTSGCLWSTGVMLGAYAMSVNGYPTSVGHGNLGLIGGGGPQASAMTEIGNQLLAGFDNQYFVFDIEDLTNEGLVDFDYIWIVDMATIGNHLLVADGGYGLVVFFDQEIFVDDLESGDTSAWAQ